VKNPLSKFAFQVRNLQRYAVGYLLQIIGLDGTTSARGALTSTFTVLTVPIFAGMAGQVVPWYTWPASLLGLVGVGLLTNSGGEPVLGDAICILSATIFGYHTLQSSKYAPRWGSAR
jgi:drug/metabolite transporter (DMT)-like permease